MFLIKEPQPAGRLEGTDHRPFHVLAVAKHLEDLPVARRHGQDHSLLGLGNPDFRVGEAFVFERSFVEVDLGSELRAHLADGRAEAAGAAVGDGVIQAPVAGLQ